MIPSKPRHGDVIAIRNAQQGLAASPPMQRFMDDLATLPGPFARALISASGTITVAGNYAIDCTDGDVSLTLKAFPVTLIKIDASANSVIISGMTVSGDPSFSWNTQYRSETIDIIAGTGYAI